MSNDVTPNPAHLPGSHSNEGVFRATGTDVSYTFATTGWTPPLTSDEIIELRGMLAAERRQQAGNAIYAKYNADTASIYALAEEATKPFKARRDEALAALWGDDAD